MLNTSALDQEDVALLCGNWEELRPLVHEVMRRTGLSRLEALLLVLLSIDDNEPEPWQS